MTNRKVLWDSQRPAESLKRNDKCTAKWKLNMYLRHISLLIDGNEDFVEKRFEIITLDSVHDKPLKRRHWKLSSNLQVFSAILPNGFGIILSTLFDQWFSHPLLLTICGDGQANSFSKEVINKAYLINCSAYLIYSCHLMWAHQDIYSPGCTNLNKMEKTNR